jgi:hypothetical protein
MSLVDLVHDTLQKQNGIIFAEGSLSYVYRISYSGRSIIKPNKSFVTDADDRGYLPVEMWIMSLTEAENDVKKKDEGLTKLRLTNKTGETELHTLAECVKVSEKEILGQYKDLWPLTKILDIGGEYVTPSFPLRQSNEPVHKEVPPIPCHIHSGITKRGPNDELVHVGKHTGKNEAYFFPPLNLAPYNSHPVNDATTRLGLKPDVTKEQVLDALDRFALDDTFYDLLNLYKVNPYDGWTIQPGLLHAPGPYITFEIQLPQDDYHMASFRLGETIQDEKERQQMKNSIQLRGLKNGKEFLDNLVDWEECVDPNFKQKHYRPSREISSGEWGKRLQIFFDNFYGEGFEINPGKTMTHSFDKPFAGLVWSSKGTINGNSIDATVESEREFLVVPNIRVEIHNSGQDTMQIWTVFPLIKK